MEESNQPKNEKVVQRVIEEEMQRSYLDYSMSVIVGRALPDVRDGLKPAHRRVLFAMHDMGMLHNKPFKKSARIVGETLGKYHPHGDMAVYDTLVRMAQDFSLRYTLIQGQGNFGSIDGDSPAAMRYCITGDTLILTNKGILPIREISDKKESKINLSVVSYNRAKNTASKFFNSGRHPIIELTTSLGYKIRGSYNHPLLCWSLKNNIPTTDWKLLEKITKDDVVILARNYGLFSNSPLELKKFYPKKGFRNEIVLPEKMNGELAFLLGALVSEGSFHHKQIQFNNKDKDFYAKIKSIILSQFKGIQLYERQIKGDCTELSIYEQKVVNFLLNIGLAPVKSDKKVIPFSVFRSTKKNIQSFLTALFEGDGSVIYKSDKRHNGKSIELTYNSKSMILIEQLKVLLLNFGIATTKPYRDKRNDCYKLIISGYSSIKQFLNEINFSSQRKKAILSQVTSINAQRMSKTDYIPFLNKYLREKYKYDFIQKYNFDRYNNLKKKYSKLVQIIDSKDKQLIDFILKQEYLFNEVTEIKRLNKKEEVYSVKVDSTCHSFVANGFINHNTEARLNKLAEEMLVDIDKETVQFVPNFDGSLQEPTVLPAKLPNLLVNGSSGIAVGMATNIPPHNIREVADAVIAVIDNPEIEAHELMDFIKGPDFPTGGIICGRQGIISSYKTGRGKLIVRAKTVVEDIKNRHRIIVTEIPYMVNKAQMIEHIAELVRDKHIIGISDIRDESDREGMRVIIELKQDANPEVVLNQLFKHSKMQMTFGVIMIALVDNKPKVLSLKSMIQHYIGHRQIIVRKRTEFELKKAELRAHILEGLIIALNNIDDVIALIKKSKSVDNAKNVLLKRYELSAEQAQAILDMRLQRLTSLEQDKIKTEHKDLLQLIEELKSILASEQKILDIIKKEIRELKESYGDERKTEIIDDEQGDLEVEDLIKAEDMVVTVTHEGYIKRLSIDTYKQQKRGGKGIIATETREGDFVGDVFIAHTHSYMLFFTDKGKVHWMKVYQIPEAGRQSKGKPIVNLLQLENTEKITAFTPVKQFTDGYIIMATKKGIIKRCTLQLFANPRRGGIAAITLAPNDMLIKALLTDGHQQIMLATKKGMANKFRETNVSVVGRTAQGVRGIRLRQGDEVIGMVLGDDKKSLLTITENGYGKRTIISDYRLINRGGVGVKNIICSERNGCVVSVISVVDTDELIFISNSGMIIRTPASGISIIGRSTQGVRLMKLDEKDKIVSAGIIQNND